MPDFVNPAKKFEVVVTAERLAKLRADNPDLTFEAAYGDAQRLKSKAYRMTKKEELEALKAEAAELRALKASGKLSDAPTA